MNDNQLLERLAAANAYGDDSAVPEKVWTRDLALREIERRMGMTQTTRKTQPTEAPRPRRPRLLAAVAAFAAVVAIGGVVLLAVNLGGDQPPASDLTTTSTTQATQPTTPATVPPAPETLSFSVGAQAAGTYLAEWFPVDMVFELDEGWFALGEDPVGGLLLATSDIVCEPDCGPADGVAVIIRQLEGTPSDLAATLTEELGAEGTLVGAHFVSSDVTSGEYAGFEAVTVDYTMDDGLNGGALVPVLWPYGAERGGIRPLVFAGGSRTVFVDFGVDHTVVLHFTHTDLEAADSFAARVEALMASDVSFAEG